MMRRKYLPAFLVFLCWLFLHAHFGNRVYGLLILVALLLIIVFRDRSLPILVATTGVILLLLSSVVDTMSALRGDGLNFVHQKKYILHDIFAPGAGLEVLPTQMREEWSLIREYGLKDYRLYRTLENDLFLHQRIVEVAWPARRDPSSHNVLALADEAGDLFPVCNEVSKKEYVALYYCP